MKYITKQKESYLKANEANLTFADVVESAQKLKAFPIKSVNVGFKMYENLLEYVKTQSIKPLKKTELYLGSLYGVKILIDSDLEPNEIKIVK